MPGSRPNGKGGKILAEEVKKSLWPTPTERDYKSGRGKKERTYSELTPLIERAEPTGQLNPQWVEWLMGFPLGWTDIDNDSPQELETDGGFWPDEPDVPRVAKGVPNRVNRLKGLGNAVVPQVAEFIGRQLMTIEADRVGDEVNG